MSQTYTINVDEVCRVEGHGNIHVGVKGGKIDFVQMGIHEGARFFEALLVGRQYHEAPKISCRICAICSAHHNVTSHQAIENALDVKVSKQTKLLREILFHGGQIESHYLHIFFLALPDFLGFRGAPDMAPHYPNEVKLALKMKKLGNTIQEIVGGRAIHAVTLEIGGFTSVPSEETLRDLREQLVEALEGAEFTIDLLKGLTYPQYYMDTDFRFLAVKPDGEDFSYFGESIQDSDGVVKPVAEYRDYINEYVVDHSNAKQSTYEKKSFFVGSLARTNVHGHLLKGKARKALEKTGLDVYCINPILNTLAQAVEGLYSIERSIEIIDELLAAGVKKEPLVSYKVKAGTGAAATEVPRGTLYHSYTIDDQGLITEADVITPTAQNLANIEFHMRQVVRGTKGQSEEEITLELEKLVRAYDPCISCSVHAVFLDRGK